MENLLLRSLSKPALDLLLPYCTPLALPRGTVLYEPHRSPAYSYFLTSGIASVVTTMSDGATTEVEIIGHEGIIGSFHLLGDAAVQTNCFMQLSGTGLRIEFARLQDAFQGNEEVRARVLEFVQEQALVISQIAACHRLHSAEQRLSLWLLMAADRTHSETLAFTQEFLAEMMGTRRTTVTAVAMSLQGRSLIAYQRGSIRILDRPGLEAAACECYRVTHGLYARLYHAQDQVLGRMANGSSSHSG
jgi:CRP-like cAMP-binding protein